MLSYNNPIEINLDQSDGNNDVAASSLIQQENLRKITAEIHRDVTRSKESSNGEYPSGSGFVYFIDGTRGAGKSTFLQSFFASFEEDQKTSESSIGQWIYIDPSRIEKSETILLPLLKALKRKVMAAPILRSPHGERLAADFRAQFQVLAGGLSLFATNQDQLKDLDPELFLDWGLERAGHGISFRANLHTLIDTACRILKVDALAIAFDDADTKFDSASEVLETIRKYLDTPRLIVLVTGDLELYSQLIRDGFHEKLGASPTSDGRRAAQRLKMIDHLEDQYLLKLFPVRRRIQLRPMWNLLKQNEFVLACSHWGTNKRSLRSVLTELLRRGLRLQGARDIDLFQEFFLKQPLRSVLQILSRCASALSTTDAEGEVASSWSTELSVAVAESLRAMALGSLYKYNVDVDAIGAGELPALVEAVFDLTVRDGEHDTTYLRPQPSDAALKSCYAALSAEVSVFCAENPSITLQYLLGGPGSVSLYGQVLRTMRRGSRLSEAGEEAFRADFKKYLGIGRKEDGLHWAWHASVILAGSSAAEARRAIVDYGVIGLNKKSRKGNGLVASAVIQQCVAADELPIFALSLVDASGPGGRLYASIFNVLGLIDRVLRLNTRNRDALTIDVGRELARVFKTPAISRPTWENAIGADEGSTSIDFDQTETDIVLSEKENICLDKLSDHVTDWLLATAFLRAKVKPSAVLIGKVWTRLYFSLERVSQNRRGKLTVAELMELFAVCVINAFLVEEFDHRLADKANESSKNDLTHETLDKAARIDRSNPLSSPKILTNKFKAEYINADNLPLTFLIASSPLLLGLMKEDHQNTAFALRLSDDLNLETVALLCEDNSWRKIQRILIAGVKQDPQSAIDIEDDTLEQDI